MNIETMQKEVDNLREALTNKGKIKASVWFTVTADQAPSLLLGWDRTAADEAATFYSNDRMHRHIVNGTPAEMIGRAWEIINALPSIEEARRAEFTKALAVAIELGKASGIEDVLVNPLVEAMHRLSENALTHHPS